jgi:hypothetical protein
MLSLYVIPLDFGSALHHAISFNGFQIARSCHSATSKSCRLLHLNPASTRNSPTMLSAHRAECCFRQDASEAAQIPAYPYKVWINRLYCQGRSDIHRRTISTSSPAECLSAIKQCAIKLCHDHCRSTMDEIIVVTSAVDLHILCETRPLHAAHRHSHFAYL